MKSSTAADDVEQLHIAQLVEQLTLTQLPHFGLRSTVKPAEDLMCPPSRPNCGAKW